MSDATSIYAFGGLAISLGGAVLALARSRAPRSFYAVDIYHMTARSHQRFAVLSGTFAAAFVAALHWTNMTVPLLAVYVLLLILYASSFARGFSGEDE